MDRDIGRRLLAAAQSAAGLQASGTTPPPPPRAASAAKSDAARSMSAGIHACVATNNRLPSTRANDRQRVPMLSGREPIMPILRRSDGEHARVDHGHPPGKGKRAAMLEQLSNPWWTFVLLGTGAGILSGALGVGSGIVFVPALVAVFLLPQKSAQGTALAVMVPMAALGALRYWHNPDVNINPALVALLVAGALVGVVAGTELAERLPGGWLRKAFAVFMVIVAVRMFMVSPKRDGSPPTEGSHNAAVEAKGESSD